jgi:hypothetical protein
MTPSPRKQSVFTPTISISILQTRSVEVPKLLVPVLILDLDRVKKIRLSKSAESGPSSYFLDFLCILFQKTNKLIFTFM